MKEDIELTKVYRTEDLPKILKEMAQYLEEDCSKEEYQDYLEGIIGTGLFADSCGKLLRYEKSTGVVTVTIDY